PTATPSSSTWEDDREAADAAGVPLPAPTASERQTHPRRRPGTGLRCAASHNPNIAARHEAASFRLYVTRDRLSAIVAQERCPIMNSTHSWCLADVVDAG